MKNGKLLKAIATTLAVITAVFLLAITSSAASYYVTHVTEGEYFICASSNRGYAIDVPNGSHVQGTYVQLYEKFSDTNEAQIFKIDHYSGDWYKIINKANGLCLNVSGGNRANGTRLWMWSNSDNTDASLWRFATAPDGSYVIQNKLGKVIDLDNNLIFNGSRIHTWDLHDGASCRWRLVPVSYGINSIINMRSSMDEGTVKICPTSSSSYSINIQYASTSTSANTVLDGFDFETNEQYKLVSVGNDYYTLAPTHCDNRYLCVNGSKITLSSSSSSYNSQWYFVERGDGYAIINRGTNKAMSCYSYYTGAKVSPATVNIDLKSQNFDVSPVAAWEFPMRNAYCTWRGYTDMSWASYDDRSGDRDYHLGIDIYGTSGKVYAASAGKVVAYSSSNKGANGRYVIIEHNLSGKTVYSFYAHLASVNVYKNQQVDTNTLIGYAGGSGNSSNSYYKTHLHFAIIDTLDSTGGYLGYRTWFSGNKTTYSGKTFYNPVYVINYDKLP